VKKKTNAQTLGQISSDIRQWRAGGSPPGIRRFWIILITLAAMGFWTAMKLPVHPVNAALFLSLFVFGSGLIAWNLPATALKTWSHTLDFRLSAYQPRNMMAWHDLQETARQKGHLELQDLECWYERECGTVSPSDKRPLRFLDNAPEPTGEAGREQCHR